MIDTYGFVITVFHCPNCYKEHRADQKLKGSFICDNCGKELNVIKSK
jgi:transposase-like protein